jgi:hypothetical protein
MPKGEKSYFEREHMGCSSSMGHYVTLRLTQSIHGTVFNFC